MATVAELEKRVLQLERQLQELHGKLAAHALPADRLVAVKLQARRDHEEIMRRGGRK